MSSPALPAANKLEELKATGMLPSPKGVALALMRVALDECAARDEIIRLLKADPALCGRLIRAANAAGRAGCRPVASVPDAVTILGMRSVRQLALGFSLVSHYREGACRRFDHSAFWARSLLVAVAVPMFSRHTQVAAAEELFVCGLLSRVGALALATVFPREYSEVLAQVEVQPDARLIVLERNALGIGHDELTGALLTDWGMPRELVEPVRDHENGEFLPLRDSKRGSVLRSLLQLSACFADMCRQPETARRKLLPQLFVLGSRVGLDAQTLVSLGSEAAVAWNEWGALLSVETGELEPWSDFECPVATPREAEGADPQPAEDDKLRLLLIDDDYSVIVLVKRLLGAKYRIFVARDGREGLAAALEVEPDIVIADWLMPHMEGTALCRTLRETEFGKGIYVILLAAQDDEDRLVEAFAAGVDDYVVKPLQPRVLAARVAAGSRVVRLRRDVERERDEIRRFVAKLGATSERLQLRG